jgi:hypothetical protein
MVDVVEHLLFTMLTIVNALHCGIKVYFHINTSLKCKYHGVRYAHTAYVH